MIATLLVLASAAMHAVWNAILKRHPSPRLAGAIILILGAMTACVAAAFGHGPAFPTRGAFAFAVGAGVFEAGYFYTLARAMSASSLAVAYTITRGGSILVVWPISVLWLGERVGAWAAAGVVLLFAGLILTGLPPRGAAVSETKGSRGLGWSIACATFVAIVYVFYKCSMELGASPPALFAFSLVVASPINVIALGRGAPRKLLEVFKASPAKLVFAGVVCTGSFLLFLVGLEESGAGRVLTLRNTSVVFAQAIAFFSGERVTRPIVIGAGLVVAGAALLGAA